MHDGLDLPELSKYTRPMLLQPQVEAACACSARNGFDSGWGWHWKSQERV